MRASTTSAAERIVFDRDRVLYGVDPGPTFEVVQRAVRGRRASCGALAPHRGARHLLLLQPSSEHPSDYVISGARSLPGFASVAGDGRYVAGGGTPLDRADILSLTTGGRP